VHVGNTCCFGRHDLRSLWASLPGLIRPGKLLKVLKHEVRPAGSATAVPVDTRVLAGKPIDMQQRVREGQFREDINYQLNVIPLVPAPAPSPRRGRSDPEALRNRLRPPER